jgi:AmmeMemoRadiSam system protein B
MLCFASICPHPPIIIPNIGGAELNNVKKTIKAMKKLAADFAATKPETVIIVSPHGPVQTNKMTITASENLSGNFGQFGDFETQMAFKNNPPLIKEIKKSAEEGKIPADLLDLPNLDHGALVPLYYLSKNYPDFNLVPIAFSFLDYQTHFKFGQIIGERLAISDKRYAIIASGDLSHRVTPEAPAGYSPRGQEFDEKLAQLLEADDVQGILNLDDDLVEEAGECGLRSIIILLGVLDGCQLSNVNCQLLSYEAPFGVGYLVGQYLTKSK